MARYSSSDSNMSLDSLEIGLKKKSTLQKKISDDAVETILVPFYEKDVLVKVSKTKKSNNAHETYKTKNVSDKSKKESPPVRNYLVNKDIRKAKQTSYLEMFRKQFSPPQIDPKPTENDIRSISPEFGDTERESFGGEVNNPATDFFNTEAYNEIYYDKLINQEINNFIEQAYEEQLKFTNDIRTDSPENIDDNNLRSISDVSQPRRNIRRATIQPIPSIKLGGLGPDMENIRPRLERARSLQRYSEKVRMENRVRIYKKSVQEEIEKKAEKEAIVKRDKSPKPKEVKCNEKSFLVNKSIPDKTSQVIRRICNSKSKSANVKQERQREEVIIDKANIINNNHNQTTEKNKTFKKSLGSKIDNKIVFNKDRIKSCETKRHDNEPATNQDNVSIPPVQISFLVNMGGLRPSTALRTLEAKHRMYQEKVKTFVMSNNEEAKNNDNN